MSSCPEPAGLSRPNTEYKVEAAHRVIDSGRTIAEVARELGVDEDLLGRWVADERRRVEAAAARNDEPLTVAERTELARLRKQVAEQEKANVIFSRRRGRRRDQGVCVVDDVFDVPSRVVRS